MVGYTGPDNLMNINIYGDPNSLWLVNMMNDMNIKYPIGLNLTLFADGSITSSDHSSFWDNGYSAILAIEDLNDFNPYYHLDTDTVDKLNMDLVKRSTQLSLAALAEIAGVLSDDDWLPVPLSQGWNFVSTPFIHSPANISSVLCTVAGKYDLVQFYDAYDSKDRWKVLDIDKPDFLNDLIRTNNTRGFWLHVTAACTLTSFGSKPVTTSVHMVQGWNMVGYPSNNTARTVSQVFASAPSGFRVQCFDKSAKYMLKDMVQTDIVLPGNGYWVYAPANWVWTVSWK